MIHTRYQTTIPQTQTLTQASTLQQTATTHTATTDLTEYVTISYLEQRLAEVQTNYEKAVCRTETKLTGDLNQFRSETTKQIEQSHKNTKIYMQEQLTELKEENNTRLDRYQKNIECKLDTILQHVQKGQDTQTTHTTTNITTMSTSTKDSNPNLSLATFPLPPNKTKLDNLTTTPSKERSAKQQKFSNTIDVTMTSTPIASPKTLFPSERAATPSVQDENRSDRSPLAVRQH
jgi:hypothetical protein